MQVIDISRYLELWPRQLQALNTKATELLFGGATEGGKSHFLRIALIVWGLNIPGLQMVLIRKKFADIKANHVEGPMGFRTILSRLIDAGKVKVTDEGVTFYHRVFDDDGFEVSRNSNIAFQHCQDERQFTSAQGVEKHVLAFDEATQISERLIRFFRGWCRLSDDAKKDLPPEARDMFPRIIYTANPIGVSVPFFRRHFVKCREPFEIEECEGFLRQFIPSRATDNLSVDLKAHAGRLAGMGDAALAKALDEGDWDAPIGDYYSDWDEARHVVSQFIPPEHWFKFRTFDWGSAEPFAVLWWAVADGEEVKAIDGTTLWFPSGSLVCYREWYGCEDEDPSKGLGLSNSRIAHGILERTKEKMSNITLTDSFPFASRGEADVSDKKHVMADTFKEHGVPLIRANTSRGQGGAQVRDRLQGIEGFPLIYFTSNCFYCRDYIPSLPRDPTNFELPAEHGEPTHICDAVRYAATARPLTIHKSVEDTAKRNPLTPIGIISKMKKTKVKIK